MCLWGIPLRDSTERKRFRQYAAVIVCRDSMERGDLINDSIEERRIVAWSPRVNARQQEREPLET
jgi:hypothetical protein